MIAAPVILMALVILNHQWTVRVILDHDSVRVRHALIVLVNVGVLTLFPLVGRHECDLLLLIPWKDGQVSPRRVQLIQLFDELGRLEHVRAVLLVSAVKSEVQIAHEEVYIGYRIRFDHIFLTKQADILENPLRHRQSLIHSILPGFQMAVDETKDRVIECELDHYAALPTIPEHVLHNIVLACIANEPAIVLFDKDDQEDLSFAHEVNLNVLLAEVAVNQGDFIFFLTAALLTAESNDVVAFVVGE